MREIGVPLPFDILLIPAFQPQVLTPQKQDDLDVEIIHQPFNRAQIFAAAQIFIADGDAVDRMRLGICPRDNVRRAIGQSVLVARLKQLSNKIRVARGSIGVKHALFDQGAEVGLQKLLNRRGRRPMRANMKIKLSFHPITRCAH